MFSKAQLVNENALMLLNALSEYQMDLERGNYDTLDAYISEWQTEDVYDVIDDSINEASNNRLFSAQELEHFSSQLKADHFVRFALIAQFFSLLHLPQIPSQIKPEDELNYLNTNLMLELYVAAGFPGFCLMSLNATMHSLLDTQAKLSALSQIIISLEKNKEQFGSLNDLIMQIVVYHWLQLFEQLKPEFKINFTVSKEEHLQRASHRMNIEEARKKLTFFEQYTLKILAIITNDSHKSYY